MNIQNLLIGIVIVVVVVLIIGLFKRKKSRPEASTREVRPAPPRRSEEREPDWAREPAGYSPPSPTPPPAPPSPNQVRMRIENAASVEECQEAAAELPGDDNIQEQAKLKIDKILSNKLASATTIDECFDVYAECPETDDPDTDETGNKALDKALLLATTHEDVIFFYDRLVGGWTHETYAIKALEKALPLATTFDEAAEIDDRFRGTYDDDEFAGAVFERLLGLASSVEECQSIRDNYLPDNDDTAGDRTVLKMLTLLDTVEECSSVWEEFGIDSDTGRAAITRAAEIIRLAPVEQAHEEPDSETDEDDRVEGEEVAP
jgi:hypothetical protein